MLPDLLHVLPDLLHVLHRLLRSSASTTWTCSGTDEDAPYHIQATSPLRDKGDPSTDITIDFDGDPRPQGDAPDIGADELPL